MTDIAQTIVYKIDMANDAGEQERIIDQALANAVAAEREPLIAALKDAHEALQTWVTIYAPDMCSPEQVQRANEHIVVGGTLAYIANVTDIINEAVAIRENSDG